MKQIFKNVTENQTLIWIDWNNRIKQKQNGNKKQKSPKTTIKASAKIGESLSIIEIIQHV